MPYVIRQDEYASLWYHPGPKVVHHRIHRFVPAGIFQEILTAGAVILEQDHASKWLSDHGDGTAVRNDDLEWARTTWGPRVVGAGLKYWASCRRGRSSARCRWTRSSPKRRRSGWRSGRSRTTRPARAWLSGVDRTT
jgi:hypothetical protein